MSPGPDADRPSPYDLKGDQVRYAVEVRRMLDRQAEYYRARRLNDHARAAELLRECRMLESYVGEATRVILDPTLFDGIEG